jgi:uncharacterized protein
MFRPTGGRKWADNTDADTATAMRGMRSLIDIAWGDPSMPRKNRDTLTATATDDIARWIVTLNEWQLASYRPMQDADPILTTSFTSANKVGRNDPCPCCSGKKYKKCCGLRGVSPPAVFGEGLPASDTSNTRYAGL